MRALTYAAFGGPITLAELPDPTPPPGGAVVRVHATGLCRSDWHAWAGHDEDITTLPHVPGHEFAGEVEAVGAGECCFGGQIWQRDFLHSVKDQSGQRHVLARQAFDEVRRLAQRVTLGSGNHQESGVGRLQLRVRRLCPLTEPAE